MHFLAAPILAQVLTVGVSDRVEGQYIVSTTERFTQGSNNLAVGLQVDWRQTSLRFGYSPSLNVSPIEGPDREFYVFHNGEVGAEYRFRHSTFALTEAVGYGRVNFKAQALAARPQTAPQAAAPTPPTDSTDPGDTPPSDTPAPADPGPGQGSNGQVPATDTVATGVDRTIAQQSFTTTASLTHRFSRSTDLNAQVGYTIAGGADRPSRRVYGLVRGPYAGVGVAYMLDLRNSLSWSLNGRLAYPLGGLPLLLVTFGQDYSHAFTPRTGGSVGLGVAYSREEQRNGSQINGIFPTAHASIASSSRVARGTLGFGASAAVAPVLDLSTVSATSNQAQAQGTPVIDPRLSVGAGIGWSRDRFSSSLDLSTAISLRPGEPSALNGITGGAGIGYDLGANFSFNTGVRGAWQTLEGATVVPPSGSVYAGIGWGTAFPLNR